MPIFAGHLGTFILLDVGERGHLSGANPKKVNNIMDAANGKTVGAVIPIIQDLISADKDCG
jgi:hypothetical protein